jgi:multidrug efflux pump
MNLSAPFIRRPIATTLLTIGIALSGIAGFFILPVAPLPQVDFPAISVNAQLSGASPETMAASVATPLERRLGVIAGVNEMTSQSSAGSTRIALQFDLNRDIDGAAREVQAAINAARNDLPATLRNNPTYRKMNPADAPVIILALTSKTRTPGQIYDAVSNIVSQKVAQVQGVGDVEIGGGSLPAVRVELNPFSLHRFGIASDDVRAAIQAATANRPRGAVENDDRRLQIEVDNPGRDIATYRRIVIAWRDGAPVHLGDVAQVREGPENTRLLGLFNGQPAVIVLVTRQPGANIIETVDGVRALVPMLRAQLPQDIDLQVASDGTSSIRASLREIELTLVVSVVLVILVVGFFLRGVRATLIPAVATVVSLLGTFGVMSLLGYSLNNISLMALTVATGFVVDDAIVVLENIHRWRERGVSRLRAALRGAREVGFTVLSISASLVAVFIPMLFMGGQPGRLFAEFAVTLSVAVAISLVISLTTTPMMCAWLLPAREEKVKLSRFSRWTGRINGALLRTYGRSLDWALASKGLVMLILMAVIALNVYLYVNVPKGFFPQQDSGQLNGGLRADQSISSSAMQDKLRQVVGIIRADEAVDSVVGFTGGGRLGGGFLFVNLKPLGERGVGGQAVIARLRPQLAQVTGLQVFLNPLQDLRMGGRSSRSTYQYTLRSDNLATLQLWATRLADALKTVPMLEDVDTDQSENAVESFVTIDRDAAARLGVTAIDIDNALYNAFGQRAVATVFGELNQYRVVMEWSPRDARGPSALDDVFVPASRTAESLVANPGSRDPSTGNALANDVRTMVPLSAVARFSENPAPAAIAHQGTELATTVSFNLAEGANLADARTAITEAEARIAMPTSVRGSFQGSALSAQQSQGQQPLLILAAIAVIYIVLGILYESLVHPLTVLSTLPSAGVGAVLALLIFRMEFSLIALIGVFLLIGIVKKNAILIIDFALEAQRTRGLSPVDAVREACMQRFRPILMTTLAAGLGALPLAIGFGEGAELRRPLGVAIIGGLIASQLLTLLTTPVVYLLLERWRRRGGPRGDERRGEWRDEPRQGGPRRGPLGAVPSSRAALALLLPLLIGVAGCASTEPETTPPMTVPDAWRAPQLVTAIDVPWVSASGELPAHGRWWMGFGDPVLNALVEAAPDGSPTVAAAAANLARAQATWSQQAASRWPTLGLDASATRSGGEGALSGGNEFQTGLSASWAPDLFGRVSGLVRSAGASAQANQADLAGARLTVQAGVATNVLALRSADAEAQLLDRTITAYERSLAIARNRYDAGVAPKSDVLQAQTQLANARADRAAVQAQRERLFNAAAVLAGRAPSQFVLEPAAWAGDMPRVPAGVPSLLLRRRPDVASAERQVAAAGAQIGAARAAYFPSISLSASAGVGSTRVSDLFNASNLLWSIGAAAAQTLFDAGATRAAVRVAEADRDAALATYRQTVLTAFEEVENGLGDLQSLSQQLQWRREASAAADQTEQQVENRYRAGQVGYVEVVSAQTSALSARRSVVQLQGSLQTSAIALIQALGGGWEGLP